MVGYSANYARQDAESLYSLVYAGTLQLQESKLTKFFEKSYCILYVGLGKEKTNAVLFARIQKSQDIGDILTKSMNELYTDNIITLTDDGYVDANLRKYLLTKGWKENFRNSSSYNTKRKISTKRQK